MRIKGIVSEDFVNYKVASMFIIFPECSFKCDNESGTRCCQNSNLCSLPMIDISADKIVDAYLTNPITSAVVCGGLEPLDTKNDLIELVFKLREKTDDDVVIYTGYYPHEVRETLDKLKQYKNIIVKFGRFIPNSNARYDEMLGVTLASDNQFARKIS